jgi:uncharacterized protein (DUF1810 family)
VSDLNRFRVAQDSPFEGFPSALAEIQSGRKRGHWIWYVFPQLAGLGSSAASREFAIRGATEAADYLRDPVLRSRYRDISAAVAAQLVRGASLPMLMGSEIDARKLVSSLTLFQRAADRLVAEGLDECREVATLAEQVLATAARQGYPRCSFTEHRLDAPPTGA